MSRQAPAIRYWDYLAAYGASRPEVLRAVDETFSSGRLILGSRVETFEQAFSAWCGCRFGVGVNSGTDALFLALKALGIGPGDEVVTVSNTAVPTVAAIRAAGAMPVFVDVEEDTFLMDAAQAGAAVTPRTRCILPVHLFGQMADMDPLAGIAARKGLALIEDCAQAAGAEYRGRRAGSMGDLAAFSFYPTKVLGGFGDGGMVVTDSEDLAGRVRRLRFYGMQDAYYSLEDGFNSRLDEVQAALLLTKLPGVGAAVERRRALAAVYDEALAGLEGLTLPATRPGRTHQFYAYTVRTAERDSLQAFLAAEGIETKVNYPCPIHLITGYRSLGCAPGSLPVTERLAGEILSLPLYPELPVEHARIVADAVRRFFAGPRRG